MGESENKTQRTDIAEASAFEEAADEDDHHHKAAETETELEARQRGGESHRGAEVAEVAADKADAEEDDEHDPLDHSQNGVEAFVEGDAFDVQCLTRFVGDVLNEAQRTDKAAQHSAEEDGADKKGAEEGEDLFPGADQHIKVAEHIAARACELVEVIGASEHGKLHVREYGSRQPAAEDQQCEAEDHHEPADAFKSERHPLFSLVSRHDARLSDGQLFFFVEQLAEQDVQRDADGGDQNNNTERQHGGKPARGEDRVRFHLIVHRKGGQCVGAVGKGQTVSHVVEVQSREIAVFICCKDLFRTVGKCHRDFGVFQGLRKVVHRKALPVLVDDLQRNVLAEEGVRGGVVALCVFHIGFGGSGDIFLHAVAVRVLADACLDRCEAA